jgi:hypothetical protein
MLLLATVPTLSIAVPMFQSSMFSIALTQLQRSFQFQSSILAIEFRK